jgi:hypothetical protein
MTSNADIDHCRCINLDDEISELCHKVDKIIRDYLDGRDNEEALNILCNVVIMITNQFLLEMVEDIESRDGIINSLYKHLLNLNKTSIFRHIHPENLN